MLVGRGDPSKAKTRELPAEHTPYILTEIGQSICFTRLPTLFPRVFQKLGKWHTLLAQFFVVIISGTGIGQHIPQRRYIVHMYQIGWIKLI